jgi:hypothetical protein
VLSIRLRRPLTELMALDDDVLATYFEVLNDADREARDGRR